MPVNFPRIPTCRSFRKMRPHISCVYAYTQSAERDVNAVYARYVFSPRLILTKHAVGLLLRKLAHVWVRVDEGVCALFYLRAYVEVAGVERDRATVMRTIMMMTFTKFSRTNFARDDFQMAAWRKFRQVSSTHKKLWVRLKNSFDWKNTWKYGYSWLLNFFQKNSFLFGRTFSLNIL